VAKDVATTGKTIAEIPGVQAETSAKVALQKPMAPEHIATLAKSGVTVPEGTTYAQAEKLVDQQLKGQGIQIDWAKLALERDKTTEAKGGKTQDIEKQLRTERASNPIIKATQEVTQAFGKVKAASGTGVGDLSLIYAYVKLLDPGSVVREGEIKLSREPTPLLESLVMRYKKARTGELLPPVLRAQFKAEAETLYKSQLASAKVVDDNYRGLAQRYGVSPENVILPISSDDEGGAATGGAAVPKRVKVDAQGNILP